MADKTLPPVAIGDSLAVGMRDANKIPGLGRVGAGPREVLDMIKRFSTENSLSGRDVFIGTGLPNIPAQKKFIEEQIDFVRKQGGNPILMGVGPGTKKKPTTGQNEFLAGLSESKGLKYMGPLVNQFPDITKDPMGLHLRGPQYKQIFQQYSKPQSQTQQPRPQVQPPSRAPSAADLLSQFTGAVMQAESRGKRYDKSGKLLTSPKGAMGEMQVMPGTVRDPGFGVRPAKDSSPDELARVGRDYAATMLRRYDNDPTVAAVAYNWGPGNADKWVKRGADFGALPKETQAYVTRITGQMGIPIAAKRAPAPKRADVPPGPSQKRAQTESFAPGATLDTGPRPAAQVQDQVTRADMDRLGPSYQAAFAAMTLADSREDDDDDYDDDETIAERYMERREMRMAQDESTIEEEAPRVSPLAGLSEMSYQSPFPEVQPVMMAEGGEVSGNNPQGYGEATVVDPTMRERLAGFLTDNLVNFGADRYKARGRVESFIGGPSSRLPLNLGLSDFVPFLGTFMQSEEAAALLGKAKDAAKRGDIKTAAIEGTSGALGLIPGASGTVKYGKKAVKAAEPTAKDLMKSLGPQLEKTLGKAVDPFGTGLAEPISILRQTGGEFTTVKSINDAPISNFDNHLATLYSRNPGPDYAPVTRFFDTKIRDYFKKQAGSVSDPVREALISGRIKIPKDSALEEMFPESLIKAARDGDVTAMKLIEKELDQGTGIKGYKQVDQRGYEADRLASEEMRSSILQQMKSNPNIIPDAMLLRLTKKNASNLSPEVAAKTVADIRAKLKANPELFSTVYEEKIMRMMPDNLASSFTAEDVTKYPSLYGNLGEMSKAREGIMALKGSAPILDVENSPKLFGMTLSRIHELMQQLPEKELDRMDVPSMLNKVIQLNEVSNKVAGYAKQAEKLIAGGKKVPEKISTYGTKPFTSVDNQGFSWREIVEPTATKIQAELLNNSIGGYARPGTYGTLQKGRNSLVNGEVRLFGLYDKNNQLMTNVEYITNKAEKLQNTIPQFFGNGPKTGNVVPENFVPQVEELINKLNPENIPPSIKQLLRDKGISFSK